MNATNVEPTGRELSALGYLSAELAARADAWNGNAPDWFPEPPEFLELWQQALEATAEPDWRAHAEMLAQALRLTQEYVGDAILPPQEGWSWFDALRAHSNLSTTTNQGTT